MFMLQRKVIIAFFSVVLIISAGCSAESKRVPEEQKRTKRLLKGYGQEDTTPKPIQFKKIH